MKTSSPSLTTASFSFSNAAPILKIAWAPVYAHPLPEGHRFPMIKYELIPEQLLYEGTITAGNLFAPGICEQEILLLTHGKEYLQKLTDNTLSAQEQRRIGFPQSPELVIRELTITQGTIGCCHFAMQHGVSLNVAGGTHHAFAERGEGFCLINDFAVASNYLLAKKLVSKILIIDLDVHQGNGTASIFAGNPAVFTFSMHGRHNYPFHKEQSDLDLELEDGTDDATYLSLLATHIPPLLDAVKPGIAFFLAGVDILDTDRFGKLKVSPGGCKQRDAFVFELLKKHHIPCVVAMGGGYSPEIKTIVAAHCNTFRLAKDIYGLE